MPGRVLVLVHRKELAWQARKKFEKLGYRVGFEIGGEEPTWSGDQIVVAMVQALGRSGSSRLNKFRPEDFSLIVCDEAHHAVSQTYLTVLRHFQVFAETSKALLLGVTATPFRSDRKALSEVFQEIVYRMDIRDAVRDGWLVDIKGARARSSANLDRVRMRGVDFDLEELGRAVNLQVRNELVLKTWKARAGGRQTIVFCSTVQHAKDMAATFQNAGITADFACGEDREPERNRKLEAHKRRELQVLANCEVLTEGYDDWSVSCIVMARPTQSELLFVQMAGRGTRIPVGISNLKSARDEGSPIPKEDCLIIDVVDNTSNHSLITLPKIFGNPAGYDYNGRSAVFNKPGNKRPGTPPTPEIARTVRPVIEHIDR